MEPGSRNSVVTEVSRRRPLLSSGSVIGSSTSWSFCALRLPADFRSDRREDTASSSSSIVSLLSLCVCLHLLLLGIGSANTFPRQQIHATVEKLLQSTFLCGPCHIKWAILERNKIWFLVRRVQKSRATVLARASSNLLDLDLVLFGGGI
jgi:hypothetical protein